MRKSRFAFAATVAAAGLMLAACGGHSQAYTQGYSAGQYLAKAGSLVTYPSNKAECTSILEGWGGSTSQDAVNGFMAGCEAELGSGNAHPESAGTSAAASSPIPTPTPTPTPTWPQVTNSTICTLLPGTSAQVISGLGYPECDETWHGWGVSVIYEQQNMTGWFGEDNPYNSRPLPGIPNAVYGFIPAANSTSAVESGTIAAYPLSNVAFVFVSYDSSQIAAPQPSMHDYVTMLGAVLANMRKMTE
jgi:hypothetical protein